MICNSSVRRAAIFCGVAVIQAGLLYGMATSTVPRAAAGAAPVIHLSLVPFAPPVVSAREADEAADEPEAAEKRSVPHGEEVRLAFHAPVRVARSAEVPIVLLPARAAERSGESDAAPSLTARGAASASASRDPAPPAGPLQGAGAAPADDAYAAEVIAWLERHKGRPDGPIEGEAVLSFVVDRRGRLRSTEVLKTSGHPAVRGLAMDALHAADPFPRAPSTVTWRSKRILVRLAYQPR
ncbi:TonB family protein [Brevundimonas sp.]|uniref:energy transducer TonB n=1 Tax=Brevundimonas sp. TaxID=1871086 RepID=UPI001993D516|nr:TonB family protein [Brevundimonas sp.]MBD3835362.1 TonB family protein [Brevundimonas sp.]